MDRERLITALDKLRFWLIAGILFFVPIAFAWFTETAQAYDINKQFIFRSLTALLAIVMMTKLFLLGQGIFRKSKIWLVVLAVGLLFFANVFVSADGLRSFLGAYERQQGIYSLLYYLLFFGITALGIKDRAEIDRLSWPVVASAGLVGLYGTLQALGIYFYVWIGLDNRVFSSFGQPNFLAHWLIMTIPVVAYVLFAVAKGRWRYLPAFVLVLQIVSLGATYSRAGYIGLACAALFSLIAYTHINRRFRRQLWYSLAGLAALCLLLVWQFPRISSAGLYTRLIGGHATAVRLFSIFNLTTGSTNTRLLYWGAVRDGFFEADLRHKLFGYGKDMQEVFFVARYRPDWGVYEKLNSFPDRAHNLIMDIWLEFGLVGLMLLSALSVSIILRAWSVARRQDKRTRWLVITLSGAIGGYFGAGLFGFPLTVTYIYYYWLLACLLVISQPRTVPIRLMPAFRLRLALYVSLVIFLAFIWYQFDLKPFIADHYFVQVKKAEVTANFRKIVDNIELTRSWFPLNSYYREQYIYYYLNSFESITSQYSRKQAYDNVLPEIRGFGKGEEGRLYVLANIAHAYSIFAAYIDKKHAADASMYYEKILALAPYITSTYQDYGRMWLWVGEYDKAIGIFRRGLAVTPGLDDDRNSGSHLEGIKAQRQFFFSLLCDAYAGKKDYKRALENCLTAEKILPDEPQNLKSVSDIYLKLKDGKKALAYLGKAAAVDALNPNYPYEAAKLARAQGNIAVALDWARRALRVSPRDANAAKLVNELDMLKSKTKMPSKNASVSIK